VRRRCYRRAPNGAANLRAAFDRYSAEPDEPAAGWPGQG